MGSKVCNIRLKLQGDAIVSWRKRLGQMVCTAFSCMVSHASIHSHECLPLHSYAFVLREGFPSPRSLRSPNLLSLLNLLVRNCVRELEELEELHDRLLFLSPSLWESNNSFSKHRAWRILADVTTNWFEKEGSRTWRD